MTFKRNFVFILTVIFCAFSMCAAAESTSVSYLGPEGTYTEEASMLFFGAENDFYPQATVSDAVQMIQAPEIALTEHLSAVSGCLV